MLFVGFRFLFLLDAQVTFRSVTRETESPEKQQNSKMVTHFSLNLAI